MTMNFEGKRVLVTGGTRGIGRATVEKFLKAGARVAVNGSSAASVSKALAELAVSEALLPAPGDLSHVDECERVVKGAIASLGGLDVLVNNAGVGSTHKPLQDTTEQEWDSVVNLNLRGVYFCTKFAVPALRKTNGSIVNVASILGLGGRGIGTSLYCASKGGVVNLTRDLAIELAPDIRVNCVCPGAVDTEMLQDLGRSLGHGNVEAGYEVITRSRPTKRVGRPEEIANAILYFASDLASFTTGAIHVVDGGVMAKAG
jgi:NAD(P)-dependent dehydrogenase (short-subunit alcohol dehydrogenase family)